MKKKTYEIPSMKVIAIKPASIICGSGDNNTNLRSGSWGSGNDPQTDDDDYYVVD